MGTNVEMLCQLRMLASNQPKEDRLQQIGWRGRVKSNLKRWKARLAVEEGDAFDDDADDEIQDYIFYASMGTEVTEERRRSCATVLTKKSPSPINNISHHKS